MDELTGTPETESFEPTLLEQLEAKLAELGEKMEELDEMIKDLAEPN